MDDYNNAAQNTYTGRTRPSNMTNTVTRTPQRRRPNTAYDGHDSGQQQHTVNANHDGYASFVNNPALGRGMETPLPNIFWPSNLCPPPGLQPSAPQYCLKMNDVPVHQGICPVNGQVSRQSFSQHPSQLIATPLLPPQVYNPTQWPLPVYHQPSEASDINEANGATAVPAARPSQQACRQGRVKTSRPTASHDVADSNTAVDCNNGKVSEYDKNTEYNTTDCDSDKDSNDPEDIKKQKRHQKYADEGYKIHAKTGKFYKICNLRRWKGKGKERPYTKPKRVYKNFERFCLSQGIVLKAKDTSKDRGEVELEYNNNGQLEGYFDDGQIREIVKDKIEESEKSKTPLKDSQEPPKKDFTMWIQSAPCQANNRLDKEFDNKCKWKGCPVSGTIRAGDFRVAFDELPYFTENGPIDPLKPALVLHLWCFERVFSREKTQEFLANGSLKGDTRKFRKEDRSLVTLEKDSKKKSRNIIEEWLEASEDDQEASVQNMIDARRQADAEDDNSGNGGCEFYQEPTYTPGHLASLTCALSAWHADMNTKYRTMNGKGTRPKMRKKRNKDKPKGIRNTVDYSLGDLEYRKEAKGRQQEYKNKAASEQHARTKPEDTEHRDSSDDPETKPLQAQAGFDTAQEEFEAAKKRLEEAKKRLDDAQQNYDEAEEKRDAEKHVEPERHVPKKKATKKKGKRNDPAAQTAVEEASESLETAKRDCRRAPKERSSAKDTDGVEKSPRSIQQSAKSHATAHTDDLGEMSGNEPAKENSEPSYIDANCGSHSSWPCLTDANGDFGGENLYPLPGTAGPGELADNKNLNCLGSLGANRTVRRDDPNLNFVSPSIMLTEFEPVSQEHMATTAPDVPWMPFTPMPTAWTPQSRVQEEAPDSDEDRPLRVKQEPSQQRGLQELPDYNNNKSDPRTVPSRVAAPRKRGQRQMSDYNDAEEPPSTKRARIAAPQQVSNAAATCHTPSYGPNRPGRNKRRADGDLDDSSHKRMCQ
ncbi:hypothetical protein MGU_06396 [Metarhizium guizhouense ARSEF 977]|uniref:Uncharacterized protein n=1 Tax=Metarhizium guizhouense (strain ARSEF 977) TaxID=1276136 RepID=A0A0B4I291_METGA|nr:hypothetical protein MGU_06396 [Metarhizium guizhouense ARSEF 977]